VRRLASASLLVLLSISILAAPEPSPVLVRIRGGDRELKALRIRTVNPGMLEMDLESGGIQSLPLAEVASIRFGRPDAQEVRLARERYREKLSQVRKAPFAGREYAGVLDAGRDLRRVEQTLAQRFFQERRPRQAMNLAALRYALGNLTACKEALRLAKDAAERDGDVERLDEACVLLGVLQLPQTVRMEDARPWKDCDQELMSGLQPDDLEGLKARLRIVDLIAGS